MLLQRRREITIMKNLSTILASISLAVTASLGVGAYVTYEKAKEVLEDPKAYVTKIVSQRIEARIKAEVDARVAEAKAEIEAKAKAQVDAQLNKALSKFPKF
jgi:LPS O-antigen subunit length determinant protein (WzzB/FepE family)